MTERVKAKKEEKEAEFKAANLEFFGSGSTLLDLALGGGWAVGRVFNIVGDKSVGKTGLAIEAFANFARKYPKGKMRYAEAEAAFDDSYATLLGFPRNVERPADLLETVEDFQRDLDKFIQSGTGKGPGLYILDSLDALTDEAEVDLYELNKKLAEEGKEQKSGYGMGKPKKMSAMFRQLIRQLKTSDCTLGIISQIRDNIGVTMGETKTRSGGKALDFYCSSIVWLANMGKKTRTVRGNTLPIGVEVMAKVKKCKTGVPFREAHFNIIFGFGIDDNESMLDYLKDQKFAKETLDDLKKQMDQAELKQDFKLLDDLSLVIKTEATNIWKQIEADLAPTYQKYR